MSADRYLGLDLGGTNIKVAVVEEDPGAAQPRIVFTARHATHAELGPQSVTDRLIAVARSTIDEVGPVETAGLGVPGLFQADTGRITLFPNLPGEWPGHSLRDPIAEGVRVPTTVINDTRAFLLAEGTLGAGRRHRIVFGVTLGTGIGGSIMIDGRIHLGAFGTAGEIGHQVIATDGPLCGCGHNGCLEALAKASSLTELAGVGDAETVYERAAAGDEASIAAVKTVAGYIGTGLANVVTLLGPDCIVVGGGIMAAGEIALDPIRRATRARVRLVPADAICIVAAELGDFAGAIGAALAGRAQAADLSARSSTGQK